MAKREMKTNNDVEQTTFETTAPIEQTTPEVNAPVKKKEVIGTVVAKGFDKLNIRKAPKDGAAVITTVNVGSKVTIIDAEKATGDWYKVKIDNDVNGYCMKKFIKLV